MSTTQAEGVAIAYVAATGSSKGITYLKPIFAHSSSKYLKWCLGNVNGTSKMTEKYLKFLGSSFTNFSSADYMMISKSYITSVLGYF